MNVKGVVKATLKTAAIYLIAFVATLFEIKINLINGLLITFGITAEHLMSISIGAVIILAYFKKVKPNHIIFMLVQFAQHAN